MKGWQYALDFPRTYHSKQSKTSCVRRRLWSRFYRFDGYDRWIKVSDQLYYDASLIFAKITWKNQTVNFDLHVVVCT